MSAKRGGGRAPHLFRHLDGPSEAPPNTSPGTGRARLVIDAEADFYSLSASFANLIGPAAVAHVHGATPTPFSGVAGVMTTTPSFPGFPAGVTGGSYAMSFDTTEAAIWGAGFLGGLGGDVAAAETAFAAALAGGMAYFNLHSEAFPGGEIRGLFEPAPIPVPAGLPLPLTGALALLAVRRRA